MQLIQTMVVEDDHEELIRWYWSPVGKNDSKDNFAHTQKLCGIKKKSMLGTITFESIKLH